MVRAEERPAECWRAEETAREDLRDFLRCKEGLAESGEAGGGGNALDVQDRAAQPVYPALHLISGALPLDRLLERLQHEFHPDPSGRDLPCASLDRLTVQLSERGFNFHPLRRWGAQKERSKEVGSAATVRIGCEGVEGGDGDF